MPSHKNKTKKVINRTESQRLSIANEIKLKIIQHNLDNDPASKILWAILDRYVKTGEPVNTNLFLKNRYDIERKYVVELHNNQHIKDVVMIRVLTPDELKINNSNVRVRSSDLNASQASMPVGVPGDWNNKKYITCSDDEECPELEKDQI